ncbi:DUF350 domain-containing protein [Halomonas sp. 86]|uniref:DUF350 domain-containing protein n=1 Tax=unclassified Halomonas TaxID=2609666 RepID=UPI004033A352
MTQYLLNFLTTNIGEFINYLATALVMLLLFLSCYSKATPQSEWKLIREGNLSAAIAFSGAGLGFTIPLFVAMTHSVSYLDFVLWSVVAFVVQIGAFYGVKLSLKVKGVNLSDRIKDNHVAYGVFSGAIALMVGLLNASSMVW